jgi:hypothetical protein
MNTKFLRISSLLLCIAWMVSVASGQTNTTINLGTQARNPDFSSMPVTKPVTVGTSLPSTCVVGQLFFNSSAAAGSNLYSCSGSNTWSGIGDSSGLSLPLSVANGGTGTSTPGLVAGSSVSITGTWPNQTINASGAGGTSGNATSIQGVGVAATAPTNNQTLVYNGTSSAYVPTTVYTIQNGMGTSASGVTNLQVNISMSIRAVTTATDQLLNTDCGGLITYNNSSGVAVALPQPAIGGNFVSGCPVTIRNYGTGTVTMTPASSTVGGTTSQVVNTGKACLVVSDGTNWQLGACN